MNKDEREIKETLVKIYSLQDRLYEIQNIKVNNEPIEARKLIELFINVEREIEIVVESLDKYKEAEECRKFIEGLKEYKLEAQRRRLSLTWRY